MFKFVMHGTYNQFSDKNQNDRFIKIFPILLVQTLILLCGRNNCSDLLCICY